MDGLSPGSHEHPVGRNGLRQAGHGQRLRLTTLGSCVRGEESEARKRFVGEELEPQGGQPLDFDLLAASLRADAADAETFFRVLAAKLADALGIAVTLERAKGLRKQDRPATGLVVDLTSAGAGAVLSARQEHNDVICTVANRVRGIALSTKPVSMGQWIETLVASLSAGGPPFGEDLDGTARAAVMIAPVPLLRSAMSEIPQQQLPADALRRLQETEEPGGKRLFTSDLSVNEFLLVEEAGFTPLGLVMGSSIYQIGIQTRRWSQSTELDKLTQAMYTARELAMARMEEEADVLGADGIVGVRLDVNYYEWGKSTAEFIAVGTAVKAKDGSSWRNVEGKPFTSDLSGQDFWTLVASGLRAPRVSCSAPACSTSPIAA